MRPASEGGRDVFSGSGEVDECHAGLDSVFHVEVGIKILGWPKIYERNSFIARTDPVNPAEALNDADGIPVDVIVDQEVAVLEVLTLRDAVGCDQQVYFFILRKLRLSVSTF